MMRMLALLLSGVSLSACACTTTPPSASHGQEAFKPATELHDAVPKLTFPRIAAGTVIGPALPTATAPRAQPTSPTARVDTANRLALYEPTADNYLKAVQIYPFSENALYRLYAAPLEVSDIALQPGETLEAVSSGDTVRWTVGDTSSGSGPSKQVHVLVKPFAAGLKTNLVILTDRRTYHLELDSTDRTSMAAVSWRYPDSELITEKNTGGASSETPASIDSGIALENLKFRYAITGDQPSWRPVRAFDDGHKVYIEFPDQIDQTEAPPLFVVGPDGGTELVNYRVRGNYYVVDRLFAAAELRLGGKEQQVVRITRTDEQASRHSLFGG